MRTVNGLCAFMNKHASCFFIDPHMIAPTIGRDPFYLNSVDFFVFCKLNYLEFMQPELKFFIVWWAKQMKKLLERIHTDKSISL